MEISVEKFSNFEEGPVWEPNLKTAEGQLEARKILGDFVVDALLRTMNDKQNASSFVVTKVDPKTKIITLKSE